MGRGPSYPKSDSAAAKMIDQIWGRKSACFDEFYHSIALLVIIVIMIKIWWLIIGW